MYLISLYFTIGFLLTEMMYIIGKGGRVVRVYSPLYKGLNVIVRIPLYYFIIITILRMYGYI